MADTQQVWLRPKLPFFDRPGESPIIRECRQEGNLGESVDFSRDGKHIVTPTGKGGSGSFLIWDFEKGDIVHRLAVEGNTIKASFSPGGRFLVGNYGFNGQRIRVWDAASFQVVAEYPRELPFHSTQRGISTYAEDISFAVSPDDKAVAVFDNGISLLDIASGQAQFDCAYEHAASLFAFGGDVLAVGNLHPDRESPSYGHLISERAYCPIVLFTYDSPSASLTPRMELKGHKGSAQAVCVSTDGHYVASCGDDGIVCLWDARNSDLIREIAVDKRGVFSLAFTSQGNQRRDDQRKGDQRGDGDDEQRGGGGDEQRGGDQQDDQQKDRQGDRLVLGSTDGSLCFYDVPSLTLRRRISCHMGGVSDFAISSDTTMCAAISATFNSLKLYSLTTPETIDNSSSEQNVSLGKNCASNLFVASSYPNYIESSLVPTPGDPSGMMSFFDGETNELVSVASLQSINRTDFPVVSEDGSCVVSKDDALETPAVTFCYWPFDEYPVLQTEFTCARAFQVTIDKQSQRYSFLSNNHYVHYSSDSMFIVCCERDSDAISVYQTDTGRRVGSIRFKSKSAKIMASLDPDPDTEPYDRDERASENVFDVSPDGRFLYAFHLFTGALRTYRIKNGKLKTYTRIGDYLPGYLSLSSGTYYNSRLTVRDDIALINTDQLVALIDMKKSRLLFELDRASNKEGKAYTEDNTHASIHPDNRLLFVTRKIYDDTDEVRERLEVWDTARNTRVASFHSDGEISNIIVEPAQCTFASSNGMLCTLFLENFQP
jgi:WD40 repeat protein